MLLNSSRGPRAPSLLAHHWVKTLFYFILLYSILFYFILFLGGLEGGEHIYEFYLLKKQGSLEFKTKQREHVTLKYFVLVRRNWVPFQVRLGREEKPLQGV